jgi:hypothetical protein
MSPCDCDVFAKMKEPLRGTRYSRIEEIIDAVGRSLLDINRIGHADGVRRLPQIWQKVVHMGGDYTEGIYMCLSQVMKLFQNYRRVATTFYSAFLYLNCVWSIFLK